MEGRGDIRKALTPDRVILSGVFLFTVAHSLPHVTTNPPLWYDEGYILQAPWNLVEQGFYGTLDQAGGWLFDPHQTTGPTLTLPAAAVFGVAGVGTGQARAVSVVYAGLAAAALYALLRLAVARFPALLGALLFSLSMYPYNRVFLGEAAGLFWVFVGARLWLVADTRKDLLLAGLALGVAALSKLALGPIALGALAGSWLLVRFGAGGMRPVVEGSGPPAGETLRGHQAGGSSRPLAAPGPSPGGQDARGPAGKMPALPGEGPPRLSYMAMTVGEGAPPPITALLVPIAGAFIPLGIWYGLQIGFVGLDGLGERFGVMGDYREQLADPSLERLARNAGAALDALPLGLRVWALPAILLASVRLLQGPGRCGVSIFLLLVTLFGAGYYLVSIGWPRYGFAAVAGLCGLTALLAALFLRGVVFGEVPRRGVLHRPWGGCGPWVQRGLVAGATLALPAVGTAALLGGPEDHAGVVVRFLDARIAPGEQLGTAEWELDFLAGRRFRHPPTYVATVSPADAVEMDRLWQGVDWVVVGPIGRIFRADERLKAAPAFTEVFSSGLYAVYRKHTGPTAGWLWDRAGATRVSLATPVGQVFRAETAMLDEIRVLLAGDGAANNASVTLRLFEGADRSRALAVVELPGPSIRENRWYRFPLDGVRVVPGRQYYFELVSIAGPGQKAPAAWYSGSGDPYPLGEWYLDNRPLHGDLYFGVMWYGGKVGANDA